MNKFRAYLTRCLNAQYESTEESGDYAIQREGDILYLCFQWSNGKEDWKNNFDFPAKPYSDMGIKWYCHRGFLRVWKAIKPHICDAVHDMSVKKIVVIGYSHGAAIATLAHEYVWYEREDLRESLEGYGFGCPRCYWGRMKPELEERWANFYPIRNIDDIVTHVPPAIFGFRHVSPVMEIGYKGQYKFDMKKTPLSKKLPCTYAHYPEEYLKNLGGEDECF